MSTITDQFLMIEPGKQPGGTHVLVIIGVGILATFVFLLVLPFSVKSIGHLPQVSMPEMTGRSAGGMGYFLLAFGQPVLLYGIGFLAFRRRVSLRLVLGFSAVFGAVLVAVYPLTAIDVFLYGAQARVLTVHGSNPFVDPPATFAGDPFLDWAIFTDSQTAYGPLWLYLASVPTMLGGDEPIRVALLLKGFAFSCLFASSVLVYLIAERLHRGSGVLAAYAVAWNPLLLWTTAGNGHNDMAMMALVLLAVYLVQRRATLALLAPAVIVLASLVKFAAVAILPLVVAHLWRNGYSGRALAWANITAAGAVLLVAPVWEGRSTLDAFTTQAGALSSTSIGTLLTIIGERQGATSAAADALARIALYGAFALIYGAILLRLSPSFTSLTRAAFITLFLMLVLATFWFRFWYVTWPLVLAAPLLGAHPRLAAVGIVFSCTALLAYVFTDYAWIWIGMGLRNHLLVTANVFAPPLLVWLWLYFKGWGGRVDQARPSTTQPATPTP